MLSEKKLNNVAQFCIFPQSRWSKSQTYSLLNIDQYLPKYDM